MKKLMKAIVAAAGIAVVLDTVNKAVFALAKHSVKAPAQGSRIYKWKYGRVRYVIAGDATLPPLLLVHGIGVGAGLHEWETLIPTLSKQYRVYALDLLGFGRSDASCVTVSSYLYALLLRDFVKNVIGEPSFIVTNNLSCSFASAAAQLAPAYFSKLLLLAPNAVKQTKPTCAQRLLTAFLGVPILGTTIYLAMTSHCAIRARLEQMGICNTKPFYTAAHHGGAPARFIYASLLSGSFYVNTAHVLRMLTRPRYILFGESDHLFPQIKDPQSFFRACRGFFDK